MKFYHPLKLLLLVSVLSGCGQMGPLYLPDSTPPIYVPKPKADEADKVEKPEAAEPAKANLTNPK